MAGFVFNFLYLFCISICISNICVYTTFSVGAYYIFFVTCYAYFCTFYIFTCIAMNLHQVLLLYIFVYIYNLYCIFLYN